VVPRHPEGRQQIAHEAERLGFRLTTIAREGQSLDAFLAEALPQVVEFAQAKGAALVRAGAAGYASVAEHAIEGDKPPRDLVAEALDREESVTRASWTAVPLDARSASGELLALHSAADLDRANTSAIALGPVVADLRERIGNKRRINRLETIVEIAQQWYRTNELEPLLEQMAEAATDLLAGDRSSIFLWDRPNKTLVARPALGVEGGELRLPDDTGVVGQVIRDLEPRRVGRQEIRDPIDHRVDEKLGYQTQTLLCVPLVSASGEVLGAFEVLNKRKGNFTPEDEAALTELAGHAAIAIENTQQWTDLLEAHRQLVEQAAEKVQLIGESPAVEALRSTVQRVASTDLAVLVLGENGTGKEVVCQLIHYLSDRRSEPFIAVNCAALTETLLESELFGHEKGAFTDAHETRAGKFELASGGTLFLDEIGDLSLSGQAKLLRVLEEKVVVRIGGSTPIHTDARVLAATNQDLAEMVSKKKFRQDLYYRLNVVTLDTPPLRERGEDIITLAEFFLTRFCREAGRKLLKFSAAARKRLLAHSWPGNVRELRNLMERLAYLLSPDHPPRIDAQDLAFILTPGEMDADQNEQYLPLADATRLFQIRHIRHAIDRAQGNVSEAAKQLGLHRSNLYRKMRQLDMDVQE